MRILRNWPYAWLLLWFLPVVFSWNHAPDFRLVDSLLRPSWQHPFGCDAFGRDLLLLLFRAAGLSAFFALVALVMTNLLGLTLGTAIAMSFPRVRFVALRVLETFLAFPSLLLALAWAAVRGPGWDTLMVALAIGTVPSFTRLIYVRTQELLAEDYVLAARSLGAGPVRIVVSHLMPALLSLSGVKAPGLFASALLAEATLSFLGVGAPIGRDTWGSLLAQGKEYLIEAPHIAFATGLPLVLTVLALQLISESRSRRHLL